MKEAFYDAVFAGFPRAYLYYDPSSDDLNKSIIGQYDVVFWFDDGSAGQFWKDEDLDKIRWYLDYNTNIFLTGWRVAFELAGLASSTTFYPGDLLYDYAGVTAYEEIQDVDLQGAIGLSGFPNMELDPDKVFPFWQGRMGWIGTLSINNPANEIYSFDSYSGAHTGKTLGVRRDNGNNKFVFLSMPFYYLKDADARDMMVEMMDWFGYEITCDCTQYGDLDLAEGITPLDVTILVNYVYKGLDSRQQIGMCPGANGDWDCSDTVDPLDVSLAVNFVYKALGSPCDPCLCNPYPTNCP
jgi:hypothetical protein